MLMIAFECQVTILLYVHRAVGVQDRCVIGRLPPGKTPIGEKVASPLKTHWGKLVDRVFQCPLAELGVLPSPVFAVYLHMMMMMGVALIVVMMTMDDPHCPWVIDLYGVVQCS